MTHHLRLNFFSLRFLPFIGKDQMELRALSEILFWAEANSVDTQVLDIDLRQMIGNPQKMVAEKSTRILGIFLFSADRFIQILPLGRVTLHLKIFFYQFDISELVGSLVAR